MNRVPAPWVSTFLFCLFLFPALPLAEFTWAAAVQSQGEFEGMMTEARNALLRDEPSSGLELLLQAEKLRPHDPRLTVLLVQAALESGNRMIARSRIDRLLVSGSEDADLLERLGLLCGRHEEVECAVSTLKAALRQQPRSYPLTFNLALAHSGQGDYAESIRLLEGIPVPPPDPGYHGLLGNSHQMLGNLKQAESHLRKSIELDHTNESVQYLLGSLLAGQKRYPEAREVLESATTVSRRSARIQLLLGLTQYMTGQPKEAEASFEAACRLDEKPVVTRERIASFYQMVGEVEKSLTAYRKLIGEAGAKAFLYYPRYADLLIQAGQRAQAGAFLDQAVPELEHALAREDRPDLRLLLGELYFSRGSIQAAEQEFIRAHARNPSVESAYRLGHFYSRQGDEARSRRYSKQALQHSRDHLPSLVLLGSSLVDRGKYHEGLELLQRALRLRPHNLRAQFEVARCHVRRQEWSTAIPLLEDLVSKHPTHRQAHFFLSKAYMAKNHPHKARDHHEAFLRLEKEDRLRQSRKGAPYRAR